MTETQKDILGFAALVLGIVIISCTMTLVMFLHDKMQCENAGGTMHVTSTVYYCQ